MNKMIFGALFLFLATSVAVVKADQSEQSKTHNALYNQDLIKLDTETEIRGKVTAIRHGQVFLQTADNQVAEIPGMAVFWGTDPRQIMSSVAVGDEVVVYLPENSLFRVVNRDNNVFLMGTYEGIYRVAQPIVSSWDVAGDNLAAR